MYDGGTPLGRTLIRRGFGMILSVGESSGCSAPRSNKPSNKHPRATPGGVARRNRQVADKFASAVAKFLSHPCKHPIFSSGGCLAAVVRAPCRHHWPRPRWISEIVLLIIESAALDQTPDTRRRRCQRQGAYRHQPNEPEPPLMSAARYFKISDDGPFLFIHRMLSALLTAGDMRRHTHGQPEIFDENDANFLHCR